MHAHGGLAGLPGAAVCLILHRKGDVDAHTENRLQATLLDPIGLCGLLAGLLALPCNANAQAAKKKRSQQAKKISASARKAPAPTAAKEKEGEPESVDLLTAMKNGQIAATAEGTGDGKITLSLKNRTNSRLRVVLPPGLIVSGATGQFGGGMGGMGGGMGGGWAGGMGGGMGGMGGGMGGMGGGMGGRGGGMGGGMMRGGGTMPAIDGHDDARPADHVSFGDYDSWDQRSLRIGMMGGMGMGGMGGGMGGMGGMGGGMGGMGGGMRSVPPTGPLETTLKPDQERHLPTPVVSMNAPDAELRPLVPAEGETLQISGIDQWTDDRRTQEALKRLAEAKAPQTIAQMVFWYVTAGASWDDVGRLCQGWGNASELALAKQFVAEPGTRTSKSPARPTARPIRAALLGDQGEGDRAGRSWSTASATLWGEVPGARPDGQGGRPRASRTGPRWPAGPRSRTPRRREARGEPPVGFGLDSARPVPDQALRPDAASRDGAEGRRRSTTQERRRPGSASGGRGDGRRLVHVKLSRGPRCKGKESFRVKIVNESPLILNGLALGGSEGRQDNPPAILQGLSLPPRKSLTVPASAEVGQPAAPEGRPEVFAADLSGL